METHSHPWIQGELDLRELDVTLRLKVEEFHLNGGARAHGAMLMSLHEWVIGNAVTAHLSRSEGVRAFPISTHFEFLRAEMLGSTLTATASVRHATRTMVFASSTITSANGLLSTASCQYGVSSKNGLAGPGQTCGHVQQLVPSPRPADRFATFLGPIFNLAEDQGGLRGAIWLEPRHANPLLPDASFDGVRLLADLFMGRAAARFDRSLPRVTVSLTCTYLSQVRTGDLVEIEARQLSRTSLSAAVGGHFHVSGRPVMEATGVWKFVGTR